MIPSAEHIFFSLKINICVGSLLLRLSICGSYFKASSIGVSSNDTVDLLFSLLLLDRLNCCDLSILTLNPFVTNQTSAMFSASIMSSRAIKMLQCNVLP